MSYSDDERIRAKRRAMYILASRDHSKKELYDKLIKNYPPDLCERVVELMCEYGYIDEEKYTEKLYRAYMKKGWGKSKIRFELKRKGLPDGLVRVAEEGYDEEDREEQLCSLIRKKYLSRLDFEDRKSIQRVTDSLAQRGFGYDEIKRALKQISEEEQSYFDEFSEE